MHAISPATLEQQHATDAVEALRFATYALHQKLDHNLPLGQAAPTLSDYAIHLTVIRDWQLALRPWLSQTSSNPASLQLIELDLEDCGLAAAQLGLPLPDLTAVHLADDKSAAFCWGIAYVLEGSRLGGQVLYRRLHASLSPHPLRYLGQRNLTGPSWPEMLALMRTHLQGEKNQDSGCRGAVAAFELLLQQFHHAKVLA